MNVPSRGYVRPPRKLLTALGIFGRDLTRLEGLFVQDSCLIVISDKDVTTWKHCKARIQIVSISTLKPIAVHSSVATSWPWKNFKGWHRSTVRSVLAPHNQYGPVGMIMSVGYQRPFQS